MARLQIGFEGSYQGRGFFRRIFGSGPFRFTPLDVALAEKDVGRASDAAAVLSLFVMGAEPGRLRLGSLFNLVGVRPFIQIRMD
ncbi:MAG: hypothetical protein IIC73_09090 [Armatimonadetes bacterium]|nr:hypothetical protein [Armatimonadota bacterium]